MFVYIEFKTALSTGIFGAKSVVLSIEAVVRGDKIERMTAWYDEAAVVVNLQSLSEKTQFDIEQMIWAKHDKLVLEKHLQLVKTADECSSPSHVKWINGGSR